MRFNLPFLNMRSEPSFSQSDRAREENRAALRDLGNRPHGFSAKSTAESNDNKKIALWTGKHLQLSLACLPYGAICTSERYDSADRLIFTACGRGEIEIEERGGARVVPIGEGSIALIPCGAKHTVKNTGRSPLKIYSAFSHPVMPYGESVK